MMDPVILYYGKGQLSGFLADPDGVLDVVINKLLLILFF
jgi:fatty acyl-CoA reductase